MLPREVKICGARRFWRLDPALGARAELKGVCWRSLGVAAHPCAKSGSGSAGRSGEGLCLSGIVGRRVLDGPRATASALKDLLQENGIFRPVKQELGRGVLGRCPEVGQHLTHRPAPPHGRLWQLRTLVLQPTAPAGSATQARALLLALAPGLLGDFFETWAVGTRRSSRLGFARLFVPSETAWVFLKGQESGSKFTAFCGRARGIT